MKTKLCLKHGNEIGLGRDCFNWELVDSINCESCIAINQEQNKIWNREN